MNLKQAITDFSNAYPNAKIVEVRAFTNGFKYGRKTNNTLTDITTYVEHGTLCSNLTNPSRDNYTWVCKADNHFIKHQLQMNYGGHVTLIADNNVVLLKGRLYYNSHGEVWLIEPVNKD